MSKIVNTTVHACIYPHGPRTKHKFIIDVFVQHIVNTESSHLAFILKQVHSFCKCNEPKSISIFYYIISLKIFRFTMKEEQHFLIIYNVIKIETV